jgi:hypothetical protein
MPVYKGCGLRPPHPPVQSYGNSAWASPRAPSPKLPWEILMKVLAAMPLSTNPAADIIGKCQHAMNRKFPTGVCASF